MWLSWEANESHIEQHRELVQSGMRWTPSSVALFVLQTLDISMCLFINNKHVPDLSGSKKINNIKNPNLV